MTSSKDLPPLTSNYLRILFRAQFLIKEQWPPSDTDLLDKVAIITGANTGLGFECEGREGVDTFGYGHPQRRSGEAEHDVVPGTGHEEIVQINYLSTVLLCILMLPILKRMSPPGIPGRVLIVSSAVALTAKPPLDDSSSLLLSFDDRKAFDPRQQYGMSKLLGHMFLYEFVDHVSADDFVVNMIEPGFTKDTELHRDVPGILTGILVIMHAVLGRSVQHSATKYLDASIVKGKESHGCYLADYKIRPFPAFLYTAEGKQAVEKLWQESFEELKFADVQGMLESIKK